MRDLKEERRLADAGLTSDEGHAPGDDPATQYAIAFVTDDGLAGSDSERCFVELNMQAPIG